MDEPVEAESRRLGISQPSQHHLRNRPTSNGADAAILAPDQGTFSPTPAMKHMTRNSRSWIVRLHSLGIATFSVTRVVVALKGGGDV